MELFQQLLSIGEMDIIERAGRRCSESLRTEAARRLDAYFVALPLAYAIWSAESRLILLRVARIRI
jgi:hypothetical protein